MLQSIAPFFIVSDLSASIAFYRELLGFDLKLAVPPDDPFFAIVTRDHVAISLKEIAPDIAPQPNCSRHEWARWDAMIAVDDPDALYEEYASRGITFHEDLADTDDGLRAFELRDADGYVLCFGTTEPAGIAGLSARRCTAPR